MGFGTLFIGFFLLLNVTYYAFTDCIAGLIISLALNKLSGVNRFFRLCLIPALIFAVLGFAELGVEVYRMFFADPDLTVYNTVIGVARYLLMASFTALAMMGIEDVSREVDLPKTERKAKVNVPFSVTVFVIAALLELPFLGRIADTFTLTVVGIAVLLGVVLILILNLATIYGAYMAICMPQDVHREPKRSKFEFVNKMREHTEEKQKEYRDYKLEKAKKKNSKKK